MIIVTGTKRSGTSMWMQVFKAAGFPLIGVAFPRDWGRSIRAANRAGFYESALRTGIHAGTNPDPRTGRTLRAEATRRVVVKVFVPGVLRTHRSYLDRVVATMRDVHEYTRSWQRLLTMERAHAERRARANGQVYARLEHREPLPADLEWWLHNFNLLRDARERGYPMHVASYGAVLADPRRAVEEVFDWLGIRGADLEAAAGAIRSELRTQVRAEWEPELPSLASEEAELCEELYAAVQERRQISAALMARFERAHERVAPRIRRAQQSAKERERHRRIHGREAVEAES